MLTDTSTSTVEVQATVVKDLAERMLKRIYDDRQEIADKYIAEELATMERSWWTWLKRKLGYTVEFTRDDAIDSIHASCEGFHPYNFLPLMYGSQETDCCRVKRAAEFVIEQNGDAALMTISTNDLQSIRGVASCTQEN